MMKKNDENLPEVIDSQIITIDDAEDLISIANRRVDVIGKLMATALKITTPRDWVSQDGSPYLVHSGAEKVARLFGIRLSGINTVREWSEDTKGKYYIYKTTGTASLPGKYDSIEALGTCSQRDKFFAKAKGEWKDTVDIDETNIMKASYSNFVVNAITHLLGFRNITWEMLAESGIKKEEIQSVNYQTGAQKMQKVVTPKEIETQGKLWDILLQLAGGVEEDARGLLVETSSFTAKDGNEVKGKTDVKYLTDKWLNMTYKKAKALLAEANGQIPDDNQSD